MDVFATAARYLPILVGIGALFLAFWAVAALAPFIMLFFTDRLHTQVNPLGVYAILGALAVGAAFLFKIGFNVVIEAMK